MPWLENSRVRKIWIPLYSISSVTPILLNFTSSYITDLTFHTDDIKVVRLLMNSFCFCHTLFYFSLLLNLI